MNPPRSTAYILRVGKTQAGTRVPFDRMYFFRKQDQALLPKFFSNAMVLILTKKLASQITDIVLPTLACKAFPYTREDDKALSAMAAAEFEHVLTDTRENFLVLVPVLFTGKGNARFTRKRSVGKAASFPAYLVARPDDDISVDLLRAAISSRAYFIIDGKEIRPLCLMCPLHQSALQGHCHLGEGDCYRFLARGLPGDFVRGLEQYDALLAENKEPPIA